MWIHIFKIPVLWIYLLQLTLPTIKFLITYLMSGSNQVLEETQPQYI